MKKILLFAAALIAAINVNAQEVGQIDGLTLGASLGFDSSTAGSVAAGEVLVTTDHITMSNGAKVDYKAVSCNGGGVYKISFDDNVVDADSNSDIYGVQGQSNPKDIDSGTPSTTLLPPASGAYFTFDTSESVPEEGGYLYVVCKISSNKSYTVFEEGTAIGYTLTFADNSGVFNAVNTITIENDYVDEDGIGSVTTANTYYNGGILWPEKILSGWDNTSDTSVSWTELKVNGMGYIAFPVYPGLQYIVNANGSKVSTCGYYYSDTAATTIVGLDATGTEIVTYQGTSDGIQSVAVAADAAASKAAVKTVENGKVVISKDGKKYNVGGAQIQ